MTFPDIFKPYEKLVEIDIVAFHCIDKSQSTEAATTCSEVLQDANPPAIFESSYLYFIAIFTKNPHKRITTDQSGFQVATVGIAQAPR